MYFFLQVTECPSLGDLSRSANIRFIWQNGRLDLDAFAPQEPVSRPMIANANAWGVIAFLGLCLWITRSSRVMTRRGLLL